MAEVFEQACVRETETKRERVPGAISRSELLLTEIKTNIRSPNIYRLKYFINFLGVISVYGDVYFDKVDPLQREIMKRMYSQMDPKYFSEHLSIFDLWRHCSSLI